MTFRINSTYSSSVWGGNYNQSYNQEHSHNTKPNHVSIWGNKNSSNNFDRQQGLDFLRRSGIDTRLLNQIEGLIDSGNMSNEDPMSGAIPGMQGLNYIRPGASHAPIEGIMTAPFGANDNLFASNSNPFAAANNSFSSSFLSLTGNQSNNIFRNTTVNANNFNNLRLTNTSIRTGNFGSQTINGHSTNIHTPSGNFNFNELDAGNLHASKTTLAGNINSYKQTKTHIDTPDADLDRTRQVIKTPTETITRTRTKGTIWI